MDTDSYTQGYRDGYSDAEAELKTAIKWLEWQQQNPRVINHNLTLFLADVKEDLKK